MKTKSCVMDSGCFCCRLPAVSSIRAGVIEDRQMAGYVDTSADGWG